MKSKKIFYIFFIIIILINTFMTVSYGFGVNDIKGKQTGADNELGEIGDSIIKIVLTIGSIVSVVVLIIMGIKYMTGSIEEKASYKKTMLPYVIGAVFVFAASTIASIIYNVAISV